MADRIICPACRSEGGISCIVTKRFENTHVDCERCGRFQITRSAEDDWLPSLSPIVRAALSHRLSNASRAASDPMITTDWLERFSRDARLPDFALQAANLLRLIGDALGETGKGYMLDSAIDTARVGALSQQMINSLCDELRKKDLIKLLEVVQVSRPPRGTVSCPMFGLTLDGWERYEAERKGLVAGRYGFIAMKFGDEALEPFVQSTIKPALKAAIGYDVIDVRDVSRAGIIDNIMRAQIRDAAFVLVDLTHDNSGA